MISCRFLLLSIIVAILLYEGVESRRSGGRSGSRGSSGSRSSSSGRSSGGGWFSGGSKSSSSSGGGGWFGSSSRSHSSSSSSSSRGAYSSSSYGSSGSGYSSSNYRISGSSNRPWRDRYYGSTIIVTRPHTYYRGGGSTLVHSPNAQVANDGKPVYGESPTITTEMIKDTLFTGAGKVPSTAVFNKTKNAGVRAVYDGKGQITNQDEVNKAIFMDPYLKTKTEEERQLEFINSFKIAYGSELGLEEEEEIIYVAHPDLAVLVNGSINYFWGEANLPKGDNLTDCTDFSPVNNEGNFTLCNVTKTTRCHKSTAEVFKLTRQGQYSWSPPKDRKLSVRFADESKVDQLAWLCPETQTCCEWECCVSETKEHMEFDPPDDTFVSNVTMFVLLGTLFGITIVVVCVCACREHMAKEKKDEQQPAPERMPLRPTAPTQKANANGGYGWNVKLNSTTT